MGVDLFYGIGIFASLLHKPQDLCLMLFLGGSSTHGYFTGGRKNAAKRLLVVINAPAPEIGFLGPAFS
jgi:hypothetical protein